MKSQRATAFQELSPNGEDPQPIPDWLLPQSIPEIPSKPPPQTIHNVLYQGAKMVLAGGAKAYKTWLLTDQGFSTANELSWLGFQTARTKTLYIDFELMKFDFEQRMARIRAVKGAGGFENIRRIGLRGHHLNEALWRELIKIVKNDGFKHVIVDPIYKLFAGKDESKAGDVSLVLRDFEALASECQASIAHGHHFTKGNQANKEPGERGSGSGVFIRDPDASLEIVKHGKGEGYFSVQTTLRSFPEIYPFVIRWAFPLFERDDTGLDPQDLKQPKKPGFAAKHTEKDLVHLLGSKVLTTVEFRKLAADQLGMSRTRFYDLCRESKLITKDEITETWEVVRTS